MTPERLILGVVGAAAVNSIFLSRNTQPYSYPNDSYKGGHHGGSTKDSTTFRKKVNARRAKKGYK